MFYVPYAQRLVATQQYSKILTISKKLSRPANPIETLDRQKMNADELSGVWSLAASEHVHEFASQLSGDLDYHALADLKIAYMGIGM